LCWLQSLITLEEKKRVAVNVDAAEEEFCTDNMQIDPNIHACKSAATKVQFLIFVNIQWDAVSFCR